MYHVRLVCQHVCTGPVWRPGRVYRVGIRVGNTECYTQYPPARSQTARGANPPSGAGPGSPEGWSGGVGAADVLGPLPGAHPPSDHPLRPLQGLRGPLRCLRAPCGQRARFHYISLKVSQNVEVSPKSVEKACHSPCSSKRCPKVTSWNSQISVFVSLLSQGINGPF